MQQSEEFSLPKKWGTLRPKFIISLVAILAFIGVVIGFFEISQSQRGIMQLLREEAQTVTEALMISAENAVQSYGEVEALVESQLLHSAQVLMQLQNDKVLSKKRFEKIMLESGVAKAFYVNSKGYLSGFEFPADAVEHFDRQKVVQFITPLFSKKLERLSGFVEDTAGKSHYAVALMRTPETFWVLCADQNVLLEFRRRVGIGRLIQDIGQNEEIAYIVLQDEEGIISATKNISSIVRLSRDPFLVQALSKNELISRVTQFEGQDVFEVVKPFAVQGNVFGLIRVGIKMDAAHQAVTRTVQRAAAVALGFIIIGVILFNFLVTHQNYALLTDAYAKIKTYTGNILQNMADAVVAVNQDGRITLFNRAAEKLFRKSAEKAVGRSCRDIIDNQTSLLDQTLLTGKGLRDEEVDYQINGHKTILNVTTTLLKNADGQIDSAVAVLKDLTEKKAWEERLQRQEKLTAMGELASGVAHEIRNPLNAISIIAQRLSWEFAPKDNADEYRELAQSMVSETRRVSQIIARFLEFARPPKLILQKHDIRA
ncbi:MAG: PAS domain-containing protein, partial [bacterium]